MKILTKNSLSKIRDTILNLLANKVDKVTGKGLSTNDYTTTEKNKLSGIATGANKYVLPTASSTLGGVKTISTVTSTSGLTACPIISGVPYYKDTNTTYGTATTSSSGLMSSSDKTKLNGIATNANKYVLPNASNTVAGGIKVRYDASINALYITNDGTTP